jgi:hypothetical protein
MATMQKFVVSTGRPWLPLCYKYSCDSDSIESYHYVIIDGKVCFSPTPQIPICGQPLGVS